MHLRNYNFLIGERYVEETVAFPTPATIHFMIKRGSQYFCSWQEQAINDDNPRRPVSH